VRRRIVLLDVTAMAGDSVCVAGLELPKKATVRLNTPSPRRTAVKRLGFKPGEIFELEFAPSRDATAPHIEDARWNALGLRRISTYGHKELTGLLGSLALASPREAFGDPAATGAGGNHAWTPGAGARSLATVRVKSVRTHRVGDRARLTFTDAAGTTWKSVPLQDLAVKLHTEECDDCRRGVDALIANVQRDFDATDCLIRIGLTRPYAPSDGAAACWLQVTNVFARPRSHFL
jgi:hypothetical protein